MHKLILALALTAAAFPQATPNRTRPPRPQVALPNEQWVALFNGKDLTGWVSVGGEKWTVEDGTIHGVGVTKGYGYLKTEKDFKDFELAIRFKCEGDGNSRIFF